MKKAFLNKYFSVTIFICVAFVPYVVYAQSDISLSTNWYNRASYNPASITRTEYLYLFTNARHQWSGVTGAPNVLNVQASSYVHSLKSAFGISLINDNIGVTRTYNPMLTYAYRIATDGDWQFSMGLSAGIFSRSLDWSRLEAEITTDPALYSDKENEISPDANLGFEFQNKHFIFGLSSTHLFSLYQDVSDYQNANHRYVYGIYKNTESELINYYGGLMFANRQNLNYGESNVSVRFKMPTGLHTGPRELFDLGLIYRTTKQAVLMIGWNISDNFRIGYAFQQSFSTGYAGNSTHEIMLEYRIPVNWASTCNTCNDSRFDWYR